MQRKHEIKRKCKWIPWRNFSAIARPVLVWTQRAPLQWRTCICCDEDITSPSWKLARKTDMVTSATNSKWYAEDQTCHYGGPGKDPWNITHAAVARSNLDAAITMRSAETELQNTIELRAMASEIAAPKPDLDARAKKRRFWSTFKNDF